LSLSFISSFAFADTTIYLVRHAEKITTQGDKDPGLTQIGLFRAQNIAKQLSSIGVTKIYSTEYKRTMQTAQPLADFQSLEITTYNPRNLDQFAEQLKQTNSVVLVVGHSNTTPYLAQLLSNKEVPAIEEDEYDNVYQVIITENSTILNRFKSIPSYALNAPKMRIKLLKNHSMPDMTPNTSSTTDNK
jgi:broad specificity phosphatase PhoE